MKKKSDTRSASAPEYPDLPPEYTFPRELNTASNQSEFEQRNQTKIASQKETSSTKRMMKALLYYTAGSAITLSIMIPSFGSFLFGVSSEVSSPAVTSSSASSSTAVSGTSAITSSTEITASSVGTSTSFTSTTSYITTSTSAYTSSEHADSSFPVLSNLEPNGYINDDYGVLDEEYICIENNEKYDYLVFHDRPGQTIYGADGKPVTVVTVDGMSYDKSSNTLYINDYHGGCLYVNLMGNGFTIDVSGECSLDLIVVYGFYYGGSVKITGSGHLTVNESLYGQCGLIVEAEQSQSCLMIDSDVTLEVYGTETAIIVRDSVMDKGIYYLTPQKLTGGIRSEGIKSDFADDTYSYSITDEATGEYSKYVKFSK